MIVKPRGVFRPAPTRGALRRGVRRGSSSGPRAWAGSVALVLALGVVWPACAADSPPASPPHADFARVRGSAGGIATPSPPTSATTFALALSLYQKAARAGDPSAKYNLAVMRVRDETTRPSLGRRGATAARERVGGLRAGAVHARQHARRRSVRDALERRGRAMVRSRRETGPPRRRARARAAVLPGTGRGAGLRARGAVVQAGGGSRRRRRAVHPRVDVRAGAGRRRPTWRARCSGTPRPRARATWRRASRRRRSSNGWRGSATPERELPGADFRARTAERQSDQARLRSREANCLRNLATFGPTTAMQ